MEPSPALNSEKTTAFKILAIDGGGIKGLYSAKLLSLFEADLARQTGDNDARIVDYADLICGTSTGGLIALALALRIPAETVFRFYETKGPGIFAGSDKVWATIRQVLLGGKFSDGPLRDALLEMFQHRTIGESHCLLCIPTYDFTNGTYGVFKYDHKEGNLFRHNSLPVVDVALATSAAPTFFPLAQISQENDTQYVDGGVWANNPALVGLTEAMWYFVGPDKAFSSLNLLSIASLNSKPGQWALKRRRRGFVSWGSDVFDLSLTAQSEFTDVFLSMLEKQNVVPMTYKRIPSPLISASQSGCIKLDLATAESFALMKQLAAHTHSQFRRDPSVRDFFTHTKLYQVKSG